MFGFVFESVSSILLSPKYLIFQIYYEAACAETLLRVIYILHRRKESTSRYTLSPEVEFVHAVSAGGSVKFLPAV